MNIVYCFSATGRSREVAKWLADRLGTAVTDIRENTIPSQEGTAVVVFPVYCQNIPEPVRQFLPKLKGKDLVLMACYGRMHHGNVLWEAQKLVSGRVIAAAYVPIGHTYLGEHTSPDTKKLEPILDRIRDPKVAAIPRERKNSLSDLTPLVRSQLGVSMRRLENCTHCGICTLECPLGTMTDGVPGKKCVRCMRCVELCPQKALTAHLSFPMRMYLNKRKKDKTILNL